MYNSHPIALELLLRKLSAESKKELVNEADPDDLRTPLHIAAYRAQPSMVKALLKEGAGTKAEDVRKNTPGRRRLATCSREVWTGECRGSEPNALRMVPW